MPHNAAYRLPGHWFARLCERNSNSYAWAMDEDGQRLRLWAEGVCLLAEVPAETGRGDDLAEAELSRFVADGENHPALVRRAWIDAPMAIAESHLPGGLSAPLRRWLSLAVAFIRWDLQHSLADFANCEALDWLYQPGRLYVTSTHVDLVMCLKFVSVPLRLAGLDRNPGWLPDFGRIIQFHFE